MLRSVVKRGGYQDSLRLMEMYATALALPGVRDAACVMGTPRNVQLMAERGLLPKALVVGAEDLVVVVEGEEASALEAALAALFVEVGAVTGDAFAPTLANSRSLG